MGDAEVVAGLLAAAGLPVDDEELAHLVAVYPTLRAQADLLAAAAPDLLDGADPDGTA